MQSFFNLRSKAAIIFCFGLITLLYSCERASSDQSGKTVFRYNEAAGITSLDPVYARSQSNIWAVNNVFNCLLQFDSLLQMRPAIAKRFEIEEQGKLYRFIIRQDVFFHDNECFPQGKGRLLIASDVVYSLNRIVDPSLKAPGLWVMNPVKRLEDGTLDIKAICDSIVEIRLNEPFPPFPGLLCMQYCSIVPYEAISFYGKEFRTKPVGTGPFMMKYWKEGVKLVLVKNPNYFESENGMRLPFLDAVSVSFIVDKQTAFLEFVKGNLDFLSGIDASYKDDLLTRSGNLHPRYKGKIKMIKAPYLNTEYLGILYDIENPLLADNPLKIKEVRQAINYGFDRSRMIRYLRNNIGIAGEGGIVPVSMPGFEVQTLGYHYDPEKARALLVKAGFPEGKGLPPITLTTNASYLDLCQYVQHELQRIGIEIKIEVVPPATLREFMAKSGVAFFRGSWIADYPDAENYLSLFYSKNKAPEGPNYTHFSDKQFDKLFEQAGKETNDSIRFYLYRKMSDIVMEEAPVVVLFYDQVLRFTSNQVHGLGINPLNLLDLKRVEKKGKDNVRH